MPGWRDWLSAARPHTWYNALAPVLAGAAAARATGMLSLPRLFLALVVAWALVVGVNFANDYSDGIRGTDGKDRTGPGRLTGSGTADPIYVRWAAFAFFGLAAAAGVGLALMTSPWLILVGLLCITAAWFYTGGDNPYGYRGFGEVAVFCFFGLVAVLGTQYTQIHRITLTGVALAVAVGCFSASINLANNLRDIPTDRRAGKNTLAVILGDQATRKLWLALTVVPYVAIPLAAISGTGALIGFMALPVSIAAAAPVTGNKTGTDLVAVLSLAGKAMLIYTVAILIGIA
nr:1,4-dihydroxy-2-naphthoate polyprenyltransferase [Corynebacterium mendelii]